jgi:hypothetical protein
MKSSVIAAGHLHFSLTVSDSDSSVERSTRVLELNLVHRQRQDNQCTGRLVGMPDAMLEAAQGTVRRPQAS